jgi:lipopolysaccharide transport system ATP-binding protein
MGNNVIKAENLGKKFQIFHQKKQGNNTLREAVAKNIKSIGKRVLGGASSSNFTNEEFWALQDLSFDVNEGDTVGIVGKNGAGKSTLLKIISRITEPTTGRLELAGRVASLLEVGTGFHTELTGRENIYLNGSILGMSQFEIKQKFDEIVDFSGVEQFLDTPVKRYSSGMFVRLAFAVAAHLEPDILVVDEVLAVGDAEFQKKCLGKMDDITRKDGRTILFVSHHLPSIMQLCKKGIYLEKGRLRSSGPIDDIVEDYLSNGVNADTVYEPLHKDTQLAVGFERIEIVDEENKPTAEFYYKDKIRLKFHLAIRQAKHPYSLFVMILDSFKRRVFAAETAELKEETILEIADHFLIRGNYSIHAFIHIPQVVQIDVAEDVCQFSVLDSGSEFSRNGNYDYGVVFGKYEWLS